MPEKCKICGAASTPLFSAKVRGKYAVAYSQCKTCDFVQTEHPYWLEEAYQEPINKEDTMILSRNVAARRHLSIILYFLFDRSARYLDYAGGFGILVRLMRDAGYDFYWQDKHAPNLFARGFEYDAQANYEAVTSFESLEHFVDPLAELSAMFALSDSVIASTCTLPDAPLTRDWPYLGLSHGQHIAFYSVRTLQVLAGRWGAHYHALMGLHILSRKPLSNNRIALLNLLHTHEVLTAAMYYRVRRHLPTKMGTDSERLAMRPG